MIFRGLLLLFFLCFSPPARAGILDPWTHPTLPFCDSLPHKQLPEYCRDRVPPEDLASIMPAVSRITKDEQIRQLREYARNRMNEELGASIESREKLIGCFAKAGDEECKARLDVLRKSLEDNVKRLRLVLALSHGNMNPQDLSVSPHIRYPASLGAGGQPSLSEQEIEFARRFQKSSLLALEKIGVAKLKRQLNISLSETELREKCNRRDPELLNACTHLENVKRGSVEHFRASMGKIRDALISELPLTLRFKETPITDDKLKKELQFSLDTLKKWKAENQSSNKKAEDQRVFNEMAYVNEYVTIHPELCEAAEAEIKRVARGNFGRALGNIAKGVVVMGVVCSATTPLVCFTVGGALGLHGLGKKYMEVRKLRARLSSSDRENPQASQHSLKGEYRDFLISAAFTAVGTAVGVRGLSLSSESSVSTLAAQLEVNSGTFFGQAGMNFGALSASIFEGLKGAALTTSVQGVAELQEEDPKGTYLDWLRSDAFTARLYESFLRNLHSPT